MAIELRGRTMTFAHPIITEDAALRWSAKPDQEYGVRYLPDGQLEGLSEKAQAIIEAYQLNRQPELDYRRNYYEIEHLSGSFEEQQKTTIRRFTTSITQIKTLNINASKHPGRTENHLRMMLYSNTFTAIEVFLCDFLINAVIEDRSKLLNLVREAKDFEAKPKLTDLIENNISAEEFAIEKIKTSSLHNLEKAAAYYKPTFKIEFPNLGNLSSALEERHDIVHRNGYKKDGSQLGVFTQDKVMALVLDIQRLIIELLNKLSQIS